MTKVVLVAVVFFFVGCGGVTAAAVIKPTCAGVRLLNSTCSLIDPQGEEGE